MNVISPKNKWIGQRTLRPDGIDKVIGSAQYAADFTMPGMVWGKVLRCAHAHALIKKIDTTKAEELDGVLAVMTGDDLPLLPLDIPLPSGPNDIRWIARGCMAREKVLFSGQPVAAVAAISKSVAEAALALIEVDYDVLPNVVDVDEAMAPDAPILHDWLETDGIDGPTNISNIQTVATGDVEQGFAEADLRLAALGPPRLRSRIVRHHVQMQPRRRHGRGLVAVGAVAAVRARGLLSRC